MSMRGEETMTENGARDELLDVAVVGGGQAGLAMAWQLAQHHLRFVVLEAGPELGHTWRSRWDSLTLFTPTQYNSLPGMAFPGTPDTYPGKDAVADYLQAYVAAFSLPVRLNARVNQLHKTAEGFEIRTQDETYRARQVVVATGPFQVPFVPPAAQRLDGSVIQLHSAGYRNSQALPPGPVLVVGGGNSGFQIAEELTAAGRQVDLSIGTRMPVLPQRLAGRDLFWWLTRLGLLRVSVASRPGRRMSRRDFIIGSSRRRLQAAAVRFRPGMAEAQGRTVRFTDGTTLAVGTVVWATGYRSDYSWIGIPGVVRDGTVIHRRGATDVPGLYFLGLSWQHTRGSALLGFVRDDAAYLASHITTTTSAAEAPAQPTPQPVVSGSRGLGPCLPARLAPGQAEMAGKESQ
jgi:putative flavoprotein involved in K+ transport